MIVERRCTLKCDCGVIRCEIALFIVVLQSVRESEFRSKTSRGLLRAQVDEVYTMSRGNKDKYENANPRKTHTIMSPEDVAAGKKSYWSELEITGSIRNLSVDLWQLTHLTCLYLNDNCLSRLPGDISRLSSLNVLDLSNNKLRSLPAELGELIYLRELLLNNNLLRSLPYELGKLFQLQSLGLNGNPLCKEFLKLYAEPNGTQKLLTYLLDSLTGIRPV
ncbi:unnamed protein product [Bemisia tabaci]|uniref:CCR4-NOT transcription complex subunit 6-like protein n=1 Tax=Bemisia tabaci TaxID=7038 RepID=A0A9P0F7F6_BEMTA|nr:unnamed protein product [Bemisia tabaci]